jgi:hypothetical protein
MAFRRPQQPKHHDHQQEEGWYMLTTPPAQPDCLIKPDNQSVTGPTLPTAAVRSSARLGWHILMPPPDCDGWRNHHKRQGGRAAMTAVAAG